MRCSTSVVGALALAFTLGLAGCNDATDGGEETPAVPASPASAEAAPVATESDDALVEGTEYNATTELPCGFDGAGPTGRCAAGVKRQWGEDGTTLVEVTRPDGSKRAIFFTGTTPTGADSAEADGSAGWDFTTSRDGDTVTITFGPESYVVVDAFVEGG